MTDQPTQVRDLLSLYAAFQMAVETLAPNEDVLRVATEITKTTSKPNTALQIAFEIAQNPVWKLLVANGFYDPKTPEDINLYDLTLNKKTEAFVFLARLDFNFEKSLKEITSSPQRHLVENYINRAFEVLAAEKKAINTFKGKGSKIKFRLQPPRSS